MRLAESHCFLQTKKCVQEDQCHSFLVAVTDATIFSSPCAAFLFASDLTAQQAEIWATRNMLLFVDELECSERELDQEEKWEQK